MKLPGGTSGGAVAGTMLGGGWSPVNIVNNGMTPGNAQFLANQMVTAVRNAGIQIT